MKLLLGLWRTSIGKKIVMAVTGLVMVGFVILHMIGNLKFFAGLDPVTGAYKLDIYAHFLREMGAPLIPHGGALWATRIILLACVVLHVVAAWQTSSASHSAKPVQIKGQRYGASTLASRTMRWGGLFIAVFIVYHILHFTTGDLYTTGPFIEGHVYENVVRAFEVSSVVLAYAAAMLFLLLHLWHGTWSLFQTLGVEDPGKISSLKKIALGVAVVVVGGFLTVPVAIYAGFGPPISVQISLKE